MPNRIIREGYLDSPRVAQLDAQAERFYFRIFLVVDDYGRIECRPELLKSWCFPVREDIRSADVTRWIAACEKAGLFLTYEVSGRRYIQIADFGQRTRTPSKYPSPIGADICAQKPAKDRLDVSVVVCEGVVEGEGGAQPPAQELPEKLRTEAFEEAWQRWKKFRAEIKKKLTPTTISQQLREFEKLGVDDSIARINQSIANGWQGLFPLKDGAKKAPPKPGDDDFDPFAALGVKKS